MVTYDNYEQRRVEAIRRRRAENKRRQRKRKIGAVIVLAAMVSVVAGTVYTVSAKDVTITEINEFTGEQHSMTVKTRAGAVRNVLEDYNIVVTDNDVLNIPQDAKPVDDSEIILKRGKLVRIITAESDKNVVVTSADTNKALIEAGYSLSSADEITLDGANLATSNTIEIKELEVNEVEEKQTIDFDTKYVDDPDMYEGEEKVSVEGVQGTLVKTYSVTSYADGTEKERHFIGEKFDVEPVSRVIKRGTKKKSAATEAPEAASESDRKQSSETVTTAEDTGNTIAGHRYSNKITMKATAYDTSPEENGGYTISASGTPLGKGIVAVDPSVIPLGTRVYVVSDDGEYVYGEALADDTGGAIKGNRIDLCYPTKSECNEFGVRNVTVYILED